MLLAVVQDEFEVILIVPCYYLYGLLKSSDEGLVDTLAYLPFDTATISLCMDKKTSGLTDESFRHAGLGDASGSYAVVFETTFVGR